VCVLRRAFRCERSSGARTSDRGLGLSSFQQLDCASEADRSNRRFGWWQPCGKAIVMLTDAISMQHRPFRARLGGKIWRRKVCVEQLFAALCQFKPY
jgi:hypothetical protein